MPRQPRYFIAGFPQHVIQRGINRQPVFFEHSDYAMYLNSLRDAAVMHKCQVHAYVLMTNHTHLLVTPRSERTIPLVMQAIGRTYVQALNRKHERTGTLWQGRYKASLVQDDRYLLTCYKYIELNPVRAGLVAAPKDYPYSSFAHNAYGVANALITPHEIYDSLARTPENRQAAYRRLFRDGVAHDILSSIRDTTNACLVLGDAVFQDQIELRLGRSVRKRKCGRPRTR